MKKVILFTIAILATTFTQSSFANNTPSNHNKLSPMATKVMLRAGTTVSFKLAEEVNSEDFQIGNVIRFKVAVNVTINGKVLIATNAYAEGMIKKVKKMKQGETAELELIIDSVKAVDGTSVDLDPSPHKISVNCGAAVANIGTALRAHVLNDTQIKG